MIEVVMMTELRRWKVGELAKATGLTVRALHHFDAIGLLHPSERSPVGHRLYTPSDVARLHRIVALRQLDVPLTGIAQALDEPGSELLELIDQQLRWVEQAIETQQRLRRLLLTVRAGVHNGLPPSTDQLFDIVEAIMQDKDRYFSPEQLATLKSRHSQDDGGLPDWQRRWATLDQEARTLVAAGGDAGDEPAQALARRWAELVHEMSGGDSRVAAAMYAKLDGKGAPAATKGVVSAEAWEFAKRAFAVGFPTTR